MNTSERYRTDAHFKYLVDMMELLIADAQYTPSELREATVLAVTHHEYNRMRYDRVTIPRNSELL